MGTYNLCGKIRNLVPYDPIEGDYQVRLDANESYFSIDDACKQEFADIITGGIDFNRYPDPYAAKLCKAFADFYGINPASVTAGNGSDELISLICGSLLPQGSRILTFSQDFSMYRFYNEIYENPVIVMEKNSDLTIPVEKAIERINREGIEAVLFSNPCNPTSVGLSREDVLKLIESVNALVVLDEAYMDFWDQSLIGEADRYENLILLKTCSKAIGFAAGRVGFAVAGPTITRALRAAKSPYNVNAISQALAACLLSKKELLENAARSLTEGARFLQREIEALGRKYPVLEKVYDTRTNFVYIQTPKAREIHKALLEASIAVRCFDGHLRINTGSPEENRRVLEALEAILKKG